MHRSLARLRGLGNKQAQVWNTRGGYRLRLSLRAQLEDRVEAAELILAAWFEPDRERLFQRRQQPRRAGVG